MFDRVTQKIKRCTHFWTQCICASVIGIMPLEVLVSLFGETKLLITKKSISFQNYDLIKPTNLLVSNSFDRIVK